MHFPPKKLIVEHPLDNSLAEVSGRGVPAVKAIESLELFPEFLHVLEPNGKIGERENSRITICDSRTKRQAGYLRSIC